MSAFSQKKVRILSKLDELYGHILT